MKLKTFLLLLSVAGSVHVQAQVTSANGVFNNTSTTANLVLQNQATTRVTIVNTGTAAGHLGIGIIPTERLHVSGNVLTTGNYISSAGIFNVNNTTADYSFQTNGTARFTVHNTSGNFGVGVVPTATSQRLEVNGNALATQLWSSSGTFNSTGTSNVVLATNGTGRLTILNTSGHVGIGATPTERLHISGGNILLDNGSTPTLFTGTGTTELNRYLLLVNSSGLQSCSGLKAGGILVSDTYAYASPSKNDLIVKGKVGIGTPFTTNPNSYALAVNGKIGAKDVQIEAASTTWPDYVFAASYKLPSLSDLEEFIATHKHLPDVPSATSVEKDGYSMSELDATLLKKVEELTLYIIEQQKQIDALKKKIENRKY
jgi:hypothetical protein